MVNGQLWTLPAEFECYLSITTLAIVGLVRDRRVFVAVVAAMIIILLVKSGQSEWHFHAKTVPPSSLVESFLVGVAVYLYRDYIALSFLAFSISAIIMLVLLAISGIGDYLVALPAAYVTIYLGMMHPKRFAVVSSGDYSYGIFLYGMPIQQLVVAILGVIAWPLHFLISYTLVVALAIFSWWCVEKPALKLRPKLFAFERWLADHIARVPLGVHLVQPARGPRLKRPPARQIP